MKMLEGARLPTDNVDVIYQFTLPRYRQSTTSWSNKTLE